MLNFMDSDAVALIHRRYWRGIQNLFNIFVPIVDRWALYDNTNGLIPIVERDKVVDSVKLNKIKVECQNRKR